MKKLRPMGKIMEDMEKLLEEMTDDDQHGMQTQEVIHQVLAWIEAHAPQAEPKYVDGSKFVVYCGPAKVD